jgi:hypothetical protein
MMRAFAATKSKPACWRASNSAPQRRSSWTRARRVRLEIREIETKGPDKGARIHELEQQVEHLVDAIAEGGLHTSRTLGQRLQAAEREVETLKASQAESPQLRIEQLIPRLADRWRQLVGNFEKQFRPEDIPAFRQEIGHMIGPIRVRTTASEILLETQEGHAEVAFLRAAGLEERPANKCGSGGRLTNYNERIGSAGASPTALNTLLLR